MCGNEQVVIFTPQNVQFGNVSFFIEVSDEEKFLHFQHGEIGVNQRCCLIGMLRLVGSGAAWRRSPHQKSAGRERERKG